MSTPPHEDRGMDHRLRISNTEKLFFALIILFVLAIILTAYPVGGR